MSGLTSHDRLQITELLMQVNQAFDAVDVPRFLECFVEDGSMTGPRQTATGHAELARWVEQTVTRPPHRHFTSNVVISPDPDAPNRATIRSHWLYVEHRDGAVVVDSMGVYEDEVTHTGTRWRVKRRLAIRDF